MANKEDLFAPGAWEGFQENPTGDYELMKKYPAADRAPVKDPLFEQAQRDLYSQQMPEAMSKKFKAGAVGVGFDVLDAPAALTREGLLAVGRSPEEAAAAELAVSLTNPLGFGEYTGPAKSVAMGMISGATPKTLNAVTEAVEGLIKAAPESSIARWAKKALDQKNVDEVIEIFKNLPRKAVEKFKEEGAKVRAAHWEVPGSQRMWFKEGSEGAAKHETAHAAYARLDPMQRQAWKDIVERRGRHMGVPKRHTDPEVVANESFSEIVDDLLSGKDRSPELMQDFKIALGID